MVQTGEVGVMENLTQSLKGRKEEGDKSPYYGGFSSVSHLVRYLRL